MKRIIFFDGDGTLWYPKSTLRTRPPQWIYQAGVFEDPVSELIATPGASEILQALGEMAIRRVLLSASPLPEQEAIADRIRVAQQVGIYHLLDEIQVTPGSREGKGAKIIGLLARDGLNKEDALMIGDTLDWDYQSAVDTGVDGLLLTTGYHQNGIESLRGDRLIRQLDEVLDYIRPMGS